MRGLSSSLRRVLVAAFVGAAGLSASQARAADEEIQVYMDEIGPVHALGLDVHLNYVPSGRVAPDFPGEEASGGRTRITAIDTFDGALEEAMAPMSFTLRLEDELDVSRGSLICHPDESPQVARRRQSITDGSGRRANWSPAASIPIVCHTTRRS